MSKQKINPIIRDAIWHGYDKKCIYCNRPVAYTDMHVDHFIPESISADRLADLKNKGVIPRCYSVSAEYNFVCACSLHNTKKGDYVFTAKSIPIYFPSMRSGVRKTRKHLIERKQKDDLGNALRIMHSLKERGIYTEEQLVAAVRADDYSEPMMKFLGVSIPTKTTRITISPALEEFFKDGTLNYYDIFSAIVNDVSKIKVSSTGSSGNAVVINDDAVLRYGVKNGVVNIKTYNRLLD